MKRAALTALAITAAVVVGRFTVSSPGATHTERVIEHRSEPQIVQQQVARGLTAEEVRDIVRSEMRPTRDEPATPPVDDSAARSVIDQGLADGKWTEEDRDRLRGAMPGLQQQQVDELLSSLIVKLNSGAIRVELMGPPV